MAHDDDAMSGSAAAPRGSTVHGGSPYRGVVLSPPASPLRSWLWLVALVLALLTVLGVLWVRSMDRWRDDSPPTGFRVERAEGPIVMPRSCAARHCRFDLVVTEMPQTAGAAAPTRSVTLLADGTFECDTGHRGGQARGRITPSADVFEWLSYGAQTPALIPATGMMEQVRAAFLRDERGMPSGTLTFQRALRRWNRLAARIDPRCVMLPRLD